MKGSFVVRLDMKDTSVSPYVGDRPRRQDCAESLDRVLINKAEPSAVRADDFLRGSPLRRSTQTHET
jgi:hypothetical protein